MKPHALFVFAVAVCAWGGKSEAQLVVVDPALNSTSLATYAKAALTEVHAAQEVLNTAQTVVNTAGVLNSVAHGNIMGLTALMPALNRLGITQPLGEDAGALADLMSGVGDVASVGQGLGGLYSQAKQMTTMFTPGGNDFRAQRMRFDANSAAGQLAAATQVLGSSTNRSAMLPTLNAGAANTATLKSAVDANVTLAGQQLIQGNQTNQLLALQLYQNAQTKADRALEEQEWRQGAEGLAARARAAAANAASGKVQLVHAQ